MYPWIETAKKRENTEWIARLKEEVKKGPLTIISRHDAPFASRMKTKVIEAEGQSIKDPAFLRRLTQKLKPSMYQVR